MLGYCVCRTLFHLRVRWCSSLAIRVTVSSAFCNAGQKPSAFKIFLRAHVCLCVCVCVRVCACVCMCVRVCVFKTRTTSGVQSVAADRTMYKGTLKKGSFQKYQTTKMKTKKTKRPVGMAFRGYVCVCVRARARVCACVRARNKIVY